MTEIYLKYFYDKYRTGIFLLMGNFTVVIILLISFLAKPFCTQLHAKDDETRENAKNCVASLASKCSDSDAVLSLLKAVFDVLNGSEGKLSLGMISNKMSITKFLITSILNTNLFTKIGIFHGKFSTDF